MPVINLEIHDKQAIGDGTRIVCMNSDYVVNIRCINCATFLNLDVKKLVLKAGLDYHEAPIRSVTESGKTYLQADLPVFGNHKTVEIGVYGKDTETGDPKYTSVPAVFECVKSILCGAVVLKQDPTLDSLDVKENGTYKAADNNVDGFYEIHVSVPETPSEVRNVELSMAGGSQLIEPSVVGRLMKQVVVTKPISLIPENIRAGQVIGGVVGNYDKILTEIEIFKDGDYTPPEGFDGFSKVTVNVDSANYTEILYVGQFFEYTYNHSVYITMDTPGVLKYENTGKSVIFTAIGKGVCSVILKDFDKDSNLVNTAHYAVNVQFKEESILPTEVNSLDALDTFLKDGVAGGIVKYTGATTEGFVSGGLYIIEDGE